MEKIIKKIIEYSFYFFVFSFVWQTKLILVPAETNYNEIAIYFNYVLLLVISIMAGFYFWAYKKKGINNKFSYDRFWLALAAWEFFIFLSIFVSVFAPISIFKYILFILNLALFALMWFFKFDKKNLIYAFLLSLLIQAFLGYYQFVNQEIVANKYLGLAAKETSTLGVSVLENSDGRILRAYGATSHPNIFGALMFFGIILTIFLLLDNNFSFKKKIGHYFILAIFSLALIISFSRSAFLALALSLVFLFFFFFIKDKKKFKKYLPLCIFLLLIYATLFFIFKPLIIDRFSFSSRLEKISINEREEQLGGVKEIILANPWLGVGAGAYHQKLLDLKSDLKPYAAQPVHNVFALVWAEIGLWGLICFILFLFFIFDCNTSSYHVYPVFIGLFTFMLLDHWLFSLPFGLLFLFFIISLTFYFSNDRVRH